MKAMKGTRDKQTHRASVLKAPKLVMDEWHHRDVGQGILLVTEHNAEINAVFIVCLCSSDTAPVDEDSPWRGSMAGYLLPNGFHVHVKGFTYEFPLQWLSGWGGAHQLSLSHGLHFAAVEDVDTR